MGGNCLEQIRSTSMFYVIEANSFSDNPLVFAAEGDILSGGNFPRRTRCDAQNNLTLAIA